MQMDFRSPKADEIVRDLGTNLNEGLRVIIECLKFEQDPELIRHLLQTASFVKIYSDTFEPNEYVRVLKYHMVLSKIINSTCTPRQITYQQLVHTVPKQTVAQLLKYRDYATAVYLAEHLEHKNLLEYIYEQWCVDMLAHTTRRELGINSMILAKFAELAEKLGLDQGITSQ